MTATFELPGLKSEDVAIDVHNNRLTVSGESATSSDREEGGYVVRGRQYGRFSRALQLPFGTKVGYSLLNFVDLEANTCDSRRM